jgi:hypothetical protein
MASLTISLNNNPGAIEDGPFARSQPGYVPGGGRFAKFADAAAGIAAQENLLKKNYSGLSPIQVIDKYAPGSENAKARNNYIDYIAQRAGVDPQQPIPKEKMSAVAAAIREFETGNRGGFKPSGRTYAGGSVASDPRLKQYSVGAPKPGEAASLEGQLPIAKPGDIDPNVVRSQADQAVSSSNRYSAFLESAIEPLRANAAGVVAKTEAVAATKENLYKDFSMRAQALQEKIIPLQEKRQALLNQQAALDEMNPLERRLKTMFNSDWDPRIIRGRMERIDAQIAGYEESYKELNEIRSGVAALSIDAEAADVDVLNAQTRSVLADAQLLGQVSGAVRQNVSDQLLPMEMQVAELKLSETMRQKVLGTMSLEMANKLYGDAQASPDGTVEVDGVKFTAGELQQVAGNLKRVDLSLRSMEHSYAVQDIQTASLLEDDVIEHLTVEQIQEALKNGGKYKGQQLSVVKLANAMQAVNQVRANQVDEVVLNTATGQAGNMLKSFGSFIRDTGRRSVDMFGSTPNELSSTANFVATQIAGWQKGFEQAKAQGIDREYVARTAAQLQGWQKQYDDAVISVAKKWGGGKAPLVAVADAWLRGNPLSGEAAIEGLKSIARTGAPAGSKMSGPVLQAVQVAQSIVRDWDSPADAKSGDALSFILDKEGKKDEKDLNRRLQQAVSAVYADALTDNLLNSLPDIARNVRDPANPGKPHPFSAVSRDDFIASVRHGDQEGYGKIASDLGLPNGQVAQRMIAEGIDGATWQAVKKEKGLTDGAFAEIFESLQAVQMSATLQALDASASARPGFSPARAYVELLNSQEALNQVDTIVAGYGKSNFGAFLVSSSAGGGYRDSWAGYAQSMSSVYTQLHSTSLRDRISQQRKIGGDPYVRMNAVLRAANLTANESTLLINAIRPLAKLNTTPDHAYLADKALFGMPQERNMQNFDMLSEIVRNHKFENPQVEAVRKKAAREWDAMQAVVGNVLDSLGD